MIRSTCRFEDVNICVIVLSGDTRGDPANSEMGHSRCKNSLNVEVPVSLCMPSNLENSKKTLVCILKCF